MNLISWIFVAVAASSPSGEIAYVGNVGTPTAQVCVVDIDSGTVVAVGPGVRDGAPQWSPDGAWLAFESGDGDAREIQVARPDGSDRRSLAHTHPWNILPRWSPDGTRITYTAAPGRGGLGSIAVYDMNTRTEQLWGKGSAGLLRPVWLPYSQLMWALDPDKPFSVPGVDIARFLREARMGRLNILTGDLPAAVLAVQLVPGGERGRGLWTDAVLVTESEVVPFLAIADATYAEHPAAIWHVEPSWEKFAFDFSAPRAQDFGTYPLQKKGEATRIAYESDEGGDREIYVLSSKGRVNVTNHRAADWNPVWSPEGRRLAFESFRDGNRGIYQVYTDTALISPLAVGDGDAWSPTWSPDGTSIAFISDRDGVAALYVVENHEGTPRRLVEGGADTAYPAWRPEYKP